MSDEPKPTIPPTWADYEKLVKQVAEMLTRVIQSNTHTLKLIDMKEVRVAQRVDELIDRSSSHHVSSLSNGERLDGKLGIVIELLRDERAATRDLLSEARATNERLGITHEELTQIRLSDRYTPREVPLLPARPQDEEETRKSPAEGITLRHGKISATFGLSTIWSGTKKHGGWISGAVITTWHFLGDHIATMARAIGHIFGH